MFDKVFQCLLKARLKIKFSKCSFFQEQIHYLGHLVSGMPILPFAKKIEALMKLKSPTNIKEVKIFLRLTGYYQKFLCNYVDIAHPFKLLNVQIPTFCLDPRMSIQF